MEIMGYTIATVPIIVGAVYGIVEFLKTLWLNKSEKLKELIPVIASVLGGLLGILVFFVEPTLLPTATWYGALITGIASGLSSVGVNQVFKQLNKKDDK